MAALTGQHAARHIAAALGRPAGRPAPPRVPLAVEPPLRWISPSAVRPPLLPPRGRFLLRCDSFHPATRLEVRQGPRLLATARTGRLIPGRPVHLPGGWAAHVDPAACPVQIRLA